MKKLVLFILPVMLYSCSTTPPPIQKISTVNLQMLQAIREDVKYNNAKTYNEINHWVDLAFGYALQNEEAGLIDGSGKVDLAKYKEKINDITGRIAAVKAEYAKNKDDIDAALDAKLSKALMLQTLIDQYEHSTGTSPDTMNALITEMGSTAAEAFQMYKQYETSKPAKEPSLSDRLNTVTKGKLEELITKLENGQPIVEKK